jgi:anti-sigma B factor antagonist
MGWPLETSTGPKLGIRLQGRGDRRTLALTGEMDLATAPALEGAVIRLCKDGIKQLVLDLSQLEFIDGSGLHAVSAARLTCQESGCELCIIPGRKELHRLFTISGLDGRLPFRPPGSELQGEPETRWREDEGARW